MRGAEAADRRRRLATALLLACAGAVLLSRIQRLEESSRGEYCRGESDYHVERGEALLHGVPLPGVARAMPSYSVPNAFLCGHAPVPAAVAVRFAALLACAVLVFALGALLYSPLCGALAALLFSFAPPPSESDERWLYTLAVLLAAYFLARRAQAPSPARSGRLAAAVGASLLMLSSLCLFPLALALYEWARDRRLRWRDAGILCLLPFLLLVPWVVMNWRLTGRFVLFEDGRVDDNVLTGAMGFVRTMGIGDSRKMAGLDVGDSVFLWAARRVLSHPLEFLSAIVRRAAYAASLHPLLASAAAASLALTPRREDRRQLALLAAYLFGIHILMPVQENYFAPAWPLVMVLASGLGARWAGGAAPRLEAPSARAASVLLAGLLAAQACVLGLVTLYPSRSRANGALDREVSRHPSDAWLRSERGMRALREGRPAEALGDLSRALSLAPTRERETAHAWALLASGEPGARVWERRAPGRIRMVSDLRESVLRGIYLALSGRREEGAAAELAALAYRRSTEEHAEADIPSGSPVPQLILEIISSWPAAKRAELIEFFAGLPGFVLSGRDVMAETWLDMAAAADVASQKRAALEMLAFTETMRLDPKRTRKLAGVHRDAGRWAGALSALKRTPAGPRDADLLLDIAARAAGADERPAALESLRFAESLKLDPAKLLSLAFAYRDIGAYSRCLALMRRPELRGPAGDDMLLDTAALAAKAGRRADALEILAFVEGAKPGPERTRRLALAYRDAGAWTRALAAMKTTDMSRPADVHMLLGLAAAAAKDGRRTAALECLSFVGTLRLDGAGVRRLALAHRDLGGYDRALALLRPSAGPGDAGMLLDLAVRAARDGRRPQALASLAFAEILSLDPPGLRSLASAYRALGDSRSAARVRRRMGDEDGLALDEAEDAAAAGDPASARTRLARVREAALADEDARRLVLLHQGLREHARALAISERRSAARPGDARWRNDRGVLLLLMGRTDEAEACWRAAIALDPRFLAPYLSLGSLCASTNRRKEALDLYERALSMRRAKEEEGTFKRILAERKSLL